MTRIGSTVGNSECRPEGRRLGKLTDGTTESCTVGTVDGSWLDSMEGTLDC